MTATPETAITRIHVEGFRSLKAVELIPGRVTVLIGPNGSGKSNLLGALQLLPLIRSQSLGRVVGEQGGATALLHYGPKVTPELLLRVEFNHRSGHGVYEARLGFAAGDRLVFSDETVGSRGPRSRRFSSISLGSGHSESRLDDEKRGRKAVAARTVRDCLSAMTFFHFHDTSINSPLRLNSSQAEDRFLRSDGGNLAAFLRRLAQGRTQGEVAAWKRIGMLVRLVAPFVKQLEPELVDPAHPDTSKVRLAWVDEKDHRFGVHDFSDGTLRMIALIAALAQPRSSLPAFIGIDEPELGLHPAAVNLLAGMVGSASASSQVLLATQSSALLDEFTADEVVVAERDTAATVLRRLDAQRLAGWLEDYSLSELYGKNVLGGQP
jgi:predicted ATPase